MSRIKLPGNDKYKRILLAILVIISVLILSKEMLGKINKDNIQNKKEEQQEIIQPANIEKSSDNTANKNEEKTSNDDGKMNDNEGKNEERNYSTRENDLYNQAYTAFFSHEYTNAINNADALIKDFPQNAMGYNIRGIAKAYNGDYDAGMHDIDKSLSIDSNYGYARFNKALTYELYGNMDQALEWYNKDLEVEEYVWTYYGIASIYGRRGDVNNTMSYLNKAIQMDAGVKNVAKTEHDFDPVKNSEEFQRAIYN